MIIDDHKMVIEGIQLLLQNHPNIKVVSTALSGEEAISIMSTLTVDVILLDINMPGLNGIETCKKLILQHPQLKIIGLSMHKEGSLIKLMLASGAKGYVLKNAGQDEIIEAITQVHQGKKYIENTVQDLILKNIKNNNSIQENVFPTLSRREKEILKLIVEENTTQEIAEKLFISFGTVETHRRNMLIKTGARNTAGLVRIAIEYQLTKT